MAMVPYKNKKMTVQGRNRQMRPKFDPTDLVYNWGLDVAEWGGKKAWDGIKGIVSAFQSKGASKQEIKNLVAPLARSLTYTSRKPKFTKAEGGLMIEHIENLPIGDGHNYWTVDSFLFQWLRNIANQFEEYQIQVWYAWNPICPATTTGQVKMAFDYDPNDNASDYATAADYFNTADHCISAIWAPAAMSPQKSVWLKTGNTGEARLYSPGKLHVDVTTGASGYLTAKYQVSLRKPQPSYPGSTMTFTGTYNSATSIFRNATNFGGNQYLLQAVTSNTLTVAATTGYKIVVWSTDANVASVAAVAADGLVIGTKTGGGAAFNVLVQPGETVAITGTVTAPGGDTSFKVSIIQMDINPLYYTF